MGMRSVRRVSHAIPLIAFFIPWWLRNWKPFSPINRANVAIRAGQRDRLERLCRYAARPPLALDRLRAFPTLRNARPDPQFTGTI